MSALGKRDEAALNLPRVDWRRAAYLLQLSRKLDALEETTLVPERKVLYQFSARGHDMAQILLGLALDRPHDAICGYYRSRPALLALGVPPTEALVSSMARAGGYSDGRDIGVVFNYPNPKGTSALPMCGVLAGGVATWNTALDGAFAFQQLVDPSVRVTGITNPTANPQGAEAAGAGAQPTAQGKARLALAAALGDTPETWRPRLRPRGDGTFDPFFWSTGFLLGTQSAPRLWRPVLHGANGDIIAPIRAMSGHKAILDNAGVDAVAKAVLAIRAHFMPRRAKSPR